MAIDAFLKLGTLKGESQADKHTEEIEVLNWSWGASQQGTTHMGSGGGAGKVNVQDISILHRVDAASPGILLACCKGTHFDEAVLTLRKAGDDPLDYIIIKMNEVMVTSVAPSGSAGSDEVMESFTLNFAKFEFSYQPQDEKGAKKGGAILAKYDIAKNVASAK